MTIFETRILCKRLPKAINDLDKMAASESSNSGHKTSVQNGTLSQQELLKKHRKHKQDIKRDELHRLLKNYENTSQENEDLYQKEFFRFEYELYAQVHDLQNKMISLSEYLDHHTNKTIRRIFYEETIFRSKLRHPRHHRKSKTVCIQKLFLKCQRNYSLKKNSLYYRRQNIGGPSYIRCNQSYLYRKKKNRMHTENQLKEIIDKITKSLCDRYCIVPNARELQNFNEKLKSLFHERYDDALSYLDKYRIRREIKLVHSIRRKLYRADHIIRVTDKSAVFHVGSMPDYERKVHDYQMKTNSYVELPSNPLMVTYDKVFHLLNELRSKKMILPWQYEKMLLNKNQIKLAYLYFIPKPHKKGTPLRPIASDGVHLIHRLQKYVTLDLLKSTTLFCTFDITDLYTMLPPEEVVTILKQFLEQFGHRHVKNMSIEGIGHLARIILTEHVFVYNNKYYRQVKGGAMGSPFTLTLANIFMWHWEQKLVRRQIQGNELYGRYIDDIFLTWKEPIEQLTQVLKEANDSHPDIKITYEISQCTSFLDLRIQNTDGQLQTYPLKYIRYHFYKTLVTLSINPSIITPIIYDENQYDLARQNYLKQPTKLQHLRASRIAGQMNPHQRPLWMDPIVSFHFDKKQQKKNTDDPMILHYIHEKRLRHYKFMIHKIWQQAFGKTPAATMRLIVGTRNNRNLIK
ncbi:unnamed protein product, partial [Rotaria magnacalcarata]|uniref:Reverse transcriptase domain-containing protein n=2 Tax=Rotaria magnacalcarata TaxID=392030 RepID=A0A816BBY5_9BILA|nr:unnamed protein product [Rotaria magnacalcarata]CAF1608056.1 unnamed protein product [Rotaria magnacalcarata]CAF3966222.1 unnamed protein product [Rotaria magnacalcarata]CAF3968024.1 unnamed protein product [Rotaria magnacalcarata]